MCKYCEKKVNNKQIIDIDDDKENSIELRQVMMEELTYTLYVELDGEDIDGYKPFDYFRINYCPMCRKKFERS